jgi:hypothetical protein
MDSDGWVLHAATCMTIDVITAWIDADFVVS